MPKYKLKYFPLRARGEIARLLFAAAGVEYEDIRVDFKDWGELKPKTLLGHLPILEIDGVPFHQSLAIHRYLAKTFGFAGGNALENLQCDVIAETCGDFRVPFISDLVRAKLFQKDAAAEEEAKNRLLNDGLAKFLPIFDKFLTDYGKDSGYFVGSKLTWADFAIFEILETPLNIFPDMFQKYPKLAKHHELVGSSPGVEAYLERRPQTFG